MCRIRLEPVPEDGEPDLANQREALGWLARRGDLAAVGMLASRLATVLDARGFLDPDRRSLGRDDVAAALDGDERTLYLLASALHAPAFGSWAEELRFAAAAIESARDPGMRAIATALAAQANLVFDPDRVPELVEQAMDALPADAHHARLLLRGQETLHLVLVGDLRTGVRRLEAHAHAGDAFAAAEQKVLLHVLGDDDSADAVAVPTNAERHHADVWGYRWPLVRALSAAARGDQEAARRSLLETAATVAASPVGLLDRDVLIGCAAVASHAGDPAHALTLLTAVRGFRSPASRALHRHYDRLARAELDDARVAAIVDVAGGLDVEALLEQELRRLRSRDDANVAVRAGD